MVVGILQGNIALEHISVLFSLSDHDSGVGVETLVPKRVGEGTRSEHLPRYFEIFAEFHFDNFAKLGQLTILALKYLNLFL